MVPSGQASGRAGRRTISPSWLCSSIRDAGSGSEVPIDLERGVEAKEVRRGGAGRTTSRACLACSHREPGPQVNQQAALHRCARRHVLVCIPRIYEQHSSNSACAGNLPSGMQGEKVRHVPMARLRLFIFPGPLHQPPVGADAVGSRNRGRPNPASQIVFIPKISRHPADYRTGRE
jgi:hypothetical protein